MKDWKQTSTTKAFAIHLVLSLVVFSSLVLTMWFYWFPGELFILDGGWQGLKIVALIDIVLGPALTLLLFRPGKKSLVLDMSVVAAFQIAALSYGFYTTHQQRTLALVLTDDGFVTLPAADHLAANDTLALKEKQPKSVAEFKNSTPALIGTELPTAETFGQFLADALNDFPPAHERSDKFKSIESSIDEINRKALSAETIAAHPDNAKIKASALKHETTLEAVQVLKFEARYGSGVVLFDPERLEIIDYIPKSAPVQSAALDE